MSQCEIEQEEGKYYYKNRMVGRVIRGSNGNLNTYFKKVKKAYRFVNKGKTSFGIQSDVIKDLQKRHILFVQLKETDTGVTYTSHVDDWLDKGDIRNMGEHGMQLFLPLKDMSKS